MIKSRISAFRMNYAIAPGLYAVGFPDGKSDIFVSANYKLSFDVLRRALNGMNAWILALDTKGINVWCAAGKGTFGTEELAYRIKFHGLEKIANHRRIIVPQLGAPGINAEEVLKRTGFKVYFGPVRASDIKGYVAGNYKANGEMRRVKFTMIDRLILTPIELLPAIKALPVIGIIILALAGIQPQGIIYSSMFREGLPILVIIVLAVLSGAFLTPVLLPFIPFRSFALKGWVAGLAVTSLCFAFIPFLKPQNMYFMACGMLALPALSSYLALQFTGASTYTSVSGVIKEIRIFMPFYKLAAVASAVLFIAHKVRLWGII